MIQIEHQDTIPTMCVNQTWHCRRKLPHHVHSNITEYQTHYAKQASTMCGGHTEMKTRTQEERLSVLITTSHHNNTLHVPYVSQTLQIPLFLTIVVHIAATGQIHGLICLFLQSRPHHGELTFVHPTGIFILPA